MQLNVFTAIGALLFVAACATTPEESSEASGGGGSATSASAASTVEASKPSAGSYADLVENAGDRVFFGFDKFDLNAQARGTLEKQAAWLKQYPGVKVKIEGHCDERGTREYNLALGQRRAAAVSDYLVALGVSSSRIETISYGKERPEVVGSSNESWAQNRRSVTVIN